MNQAIPFHVKAFVLMITNARLVSVMAGVLAGIVFAGLSTTGLGVGLELLPTWYVFLAGSVATTIAVYVTLARPY